MVLALPDRELAFSVPMPDGPAGDGVRRCQFGWFRPADPTTTLPDLCTDEFGRDHGTSIPPPLIRQSVIREMQEQAERILPPQLQTLIARARQPVLQPIFDFEAPRIVFGRAVLLGDAAFVARPHVGTGVTKAALDAQELVDCIAASCGMLDTALDRYDRERRRFGRLLVERGRYLGRYVGTTQNPALGRDPRLAIREIGAAGVIARQTGAPWP
jgi:2-polyprenyl-6-methoxyphenol hydroxylase-like FAD-dependent oxidoreductase